MRIISGVVLLLTVSSCASAPLRHNVLRYNVLKPDGGKADKKLQGIIPVPFGSHVRLYIDPKKCDGCSASINELTVNGAPKSIRDSTLPVVLESGLGLLISEPSVVKARIEIIQLSSPNDSTKEEIAFDFRTEESKEPAWLITDTVAYAVTRQSGNTAIAGAGLFFDLPHWGFLRWSKGWLRWSFVTHLLPPAQAGSAADIGISPIGVGLFGNRLVLGVGWDISRRGLRPNEHNRYVYIGFSVSELLKPKPPE